MNEIRVGLLTYHTTLNFGASLQAFALINTLTTLGASASIIDYRNPRVDKTSPDYRAIVSLDPRKLSSTLSGLFRAWVGQPKRCAFRSFANQHLRIAARQYNSPVEIMREPPGYDLYIIGSDQVWNYEINGRDSIYFGAFVRDKLRLATFASSIGLDAIPEDFRNFYSEGLTPISRISVRETRAADIVEDVLGRRPRVDADPVFLLDRASWLNLAGVDDGTISGHEVFTYFLASKNTRLAGEAALASSSLRKLRRLKFAGGIRLLDIPSPSVSLDLGRGPIDFVKSIATSRFVMTDSFHATALAILLDSPFGVVLKGEPGKDARILEILEHFDLLDRIVTVGEELVLERPSASADTQMTATKLRASSLEYLHSLLETARDS